MHLYTLPYKYLYISIQTGHSSNSLKKLLQVCLYHHRTCQVDNRHAVKHTKLTPCVLCFKEMQCNTFTVSLNMLIGVLLGQHSRQMHYTPLGYTGHTWEGQATRFLRIFSSTWNIDQINPITFSEVPQDKRTKKQKTGLGSYFYKPNIPTWIRS